jgi:hypothetical protein
MTSTLELGQYVMFIALLDLQEIPLLKKYVNTQCEGTFSSDKKLSSEGSDLIKLCHDALQLMTVIYHKYLSIRLINGNVLPNIDPFKDDGSKCWKKWYLQAPPCDLDWSGTLTSFRNTPL